MRKVDIADMRRKGWKVEVRHFRHVLLNGGGTVSERVYGRNDCVGLERAPNGGQTTVALTALDGSTYRGISICPPDEEFNRRLGENIAVGRALFEVGIFKT